MPKRLRLALLWFVVYIMAVSAAIGFAYLAKALVSLGWHPLVIVVVAPPVLLIPGFFITRFIEATIFKD